VSGWRNFCYFFLCAGILQQVKTYDRVRAAAACNTDTDFEGKKGKNYFYHSLQEKTANKLMDVLLIMCTTLFSPLLAAYQLILVHSQEKNY